MPINNNPLSVAEIFESAENKSPTQIADDAALRQKFIKDFQFDPEVSLWDEQELKRKEELAKVQKSFNRNQEVLNPFIQDETKAKLVFDDADNLGAIGTGVGALNFKSLSNAELEDKILSIVPKISPKNANLAKKYQETKTKKNKPYAIDTAQSLITTSQSNRSLNLPKIPEQRIEPVNEQGNRYTNAVKRGAANIYQTVALLHDVGYLGFERTAEALGGDTVGTPINSSLQPTTNKLFMAMEELKKEKYGTSDSLNNLMQGADFAGKQAEQQGDSSFWAAVKYIASNGSAGDLGEVLAETVPSLALGFGSGAAARATAGAAAERFVAGRAGALASRAGEVVDPVRLSRFASGAGGAIQGATIGFTTDFAGSAGAEYSSAYNQGKSMGDAIEYSLRRSLAQAGISGLGGAFLPLEFGSALRTAVGQSGIQSLSGYASAAAGAAAVGEELNPSEAALNAIIGGITALPEVIAVGAGETISRKRLMEEIEGGLIESALAQKAAQEDDQNAKAGYFSGVIGNLIQRVKESKTAGRSEETLREFINQVQQDSGAVDAAYIDIESFNQTLEKYNVPLEDLFELSPELARQWTKVEDIDGTIRIPLDELLSLSYKIDNDPLLRDIVNNLRSDPLAPTAIEAELSIKKTAEEMKQDVKQITETYAQIRQAQDELATVEQLISDDLKNLENGFSDNFNRQATTLVGAFYETLANRMKIPARDLYNAMPVRLASDRAEAQNLIQGMDGNPEAATEAFNQSNDNYNKTTSEFKDYLKNKYDIELSLTGSNDLNLAKIVVPASARNSGIGSKVMQEIINYADINKKRISLTPSSDFGGNKKRLTEFYKRYGFVENKGRNKDFSVSEAMYRDAQDSYNQNFENETRGQIIFRKDKKGAVIILGKNANFSTFSHEMGHHFLELNMAFARSPEAPEQLKQDMNTVLKWANLPDDLSSWNKLTPEQKTEVHEKFAETFEQYMFTGKAPSNALRQVFSRFRSFMAAVYKNMGRFLGINKRADLNPEITAVMDRMLASQDAIDQVQRQRNLEMMITPELATKLGIPFKEYLEIQENHLEATEAAINELEQKTIKDLAWYRNLRNKHIKAFNEQAKRVRQQAREKVAKEVAQMPVYQAMAFLRQPVEAVEKVKRDPNVIDRSRDTMIEAIAKMGGIDAAEIESTWGIDQPESYKVNVGRVKKVARKNGLSIETVAERLAEDGYLDKDESGKFDTRQFEELFTDSLSGAQHYSMYADYELVNYADDYSIAMSDIEEFPDAAKLNLEWLKAKYGEDSEIYKAIPKGGKYGFTSKDGYDPEMIAERFGFTSADQMIREMVEAPAPKELIDERAADLVQAEHSELFDSLSVEQAIDEAVHNDIRAQMLSRELAAISKLSGRHSEMNQAAIDISNNLINSTIISDIRPSVYSATELKLARAYDKALKSGNTTEAVRIKRNQLVNFHSTKKAYAIQDQIGKLKELEKKVNGSDERLAKARDFNYVSIARYVLAAYGISNRQANFVNELKSIREYDPIAWAELKDLIDNLPDIQDYRQLEYKDFQVIDDTIRQIWHLSKETKKFVLGNEKLERQAVIDDLTRQLNTKPVRSRVYNGPGSGNRAIQKVGSQFKSFIASLRRAEQFVTWLDGGKPTGVFHKYIFNPIQESLAQYRIEQRAMMKELLDIYTQFDKSEGKIYAESLDHTFNSKQELLHAVLHSGNLSNKQRLVYGYKWGEELPDGTVDFSKWDTYLLEAMNNGTITKKDMDAVQRIWDMFEGYKKQAQIVHKRMNGRYFEELPSQPLITPYGTYKGGYIPADYDPIRSAEADIRSEKNRADLEKDNIASATTGANFTKSRAANYKGDILLLDLTRLPLHLDRELRYIHLEQQVKQVDSLLRNREFRRELESVAPYVKNILGDWLSAVATQQTYKPTSSNLGDRIVENLKRNSGIVLMAGNFKNAVEAWTSLPQVLVEVNAKDMSLSSAKYFSNAFASESMTKQVRELSPFMDTRLDNTSNEYRYQLENLAINPSIVKRGSDFIKNNAYIVQQVLQVPLEVISWNAAYNQALTRGLGDDQAVKYADGVIRQYLNDMTPEGISSVERGSPLVRAMLMFYGWFNMVSNTFFTQTKLANENLTGAAKYGRYTYLYGMMLALPAILSKALTLTFNGELFDNEDEDDWQADLVNIGVQSQAEMIFGMLPFARDIINPIYRTSVDATIYSDRYSVSPLISMMENLTKTGKRIIDTTKEEKEVDYSALTKGIIQASTFVTGIPFSLVQRPATYAADVLIDEDQEPRNAAEVARGLVNGN